jgi:hypothetical protein
MIDGKKEIQMRDIHVFLTSRIPHAAWTHNVHTLGDHGSNCVRIELIQRRNESGGADS